MAGIIDNVKVRVRTHNPSNVKSGEFRNIDEAIAFLNILR